MASWPRLIGGVDGASFAARLSQRDSSWLLPPPRLGGVMPRKGSSGWLRRLHALAASCPDGATAALSHPAGVANLRTRAMSSFRLGRMHVVAPRRHIAGAAACTATFSAAAPLDGQRQARSEGARVRPRGWEGRACGVVPVGVGTGQELFLCS